MTRWLSEDEQRAWRGLLQMTARLDARINRELQDTSGISKADYDVLVMLSEAPGGTLRMFELSQVLTWEQSRLSHHLARMQKRGLVERQDCETDRRGAFVVLTAAGRAAIEAAAPAHVATVRRLVFDVATPQQIAVLAALSTSVLEQLDAIEA